MGFEPVLSERGNVYYNPKLNVQDACLAEVPTCQIFLLIIGGRFGSNYKENSGSITNNEYREAAKAGIPIFALVDQQVNSEFLVYTKNKDAGIIDISKIKYPSVDSTKIFDFMEEVQGNAVNNALTSFASYIELESYLRQQWASMMYNFLSQQSETKRVATLLETLTTMNDRIEFLAKQILKIVGNNKSKARAEIYEKIQKYINFTTLKQCGLEVSPEDVINYVSISDLVRGLNTEIIEDDKTVNLKVTRSSGITKTISFDKKYFQKITEDYELMRHDALRILKKFQVVPSGFLLQGLVHLTSQFKRMKGRPPREVA